MKALVFGLVVFLGTVTLGLAEDKQIINDTNDEISYSVGYQIGGDFQRQGVKLNPEVLIRGMQDALAGSTKLMTDQDMRQTLINLKKNIEAKEDQHLAKLQQARTKGLAFLAKNAENKDVVTLPSGLQYQVNKEGTGATPSSSDRVVVNYRGMTLDGDEFDSSYKDGKPATFAVDQAILGWQEALQLMKEGSQWKLFLPPSLGYGNNGPLEGQVTIFELELIEIVHN